MCHIANRFMKTIGFLLINDCLPTAFIGPLTMFQKANDFQSEPIFDIKIIGLKKGMVQVDQTVSIECKHTIYDTDQCDLIIIPAVHDQRLTTAIEVNQPFYPWLRQAYENGSEIASICIGAFVLAASGLLNGKMCSTHWVAADYFKQVFPDVNLVPQHIITDYEGLYTSGGAFSFQNLILYLIEKYKSKEAAVWLAKILLVDMNKPSQLPFMIFNGAHHHGDQEILKAQEIIEGDYDSIERVNDVADQVSIPKRSFIRRFKKATQLTPIQYLQKVKVEAAKKALEKTTQTVSEIMYEVGYNDMKSFRNLFKKETGTSPLSYRRKFSSWAPSEVNQ